MTDPAGTSTPDLARPPSSPAAALPSDAHEGAAALVPPEPREGPSLTQGPIGRTLRQLALPAVMSNLFMMLFITADAAWVGWKVGPAGLAAVTASSFWIWMIVSVGEMVSIGLTAVAARRHGERHPDSAARAVGDALRLAIGLAFVTAATALIGLESIFRWLNVAEPVALLGTQYLGTYLVGLPLIFGFFAVDAAFRASGDTRTPFVLLLVSVTFTLVLDPLLITGWGPLPRMGIAGAAIATLLTRSIAFGIGAAILARRGMIRLAPISWPTLGAICRVGLPTAATGILFSIIYVAIARIAAPFGVPALAALGVGHRIEAWMFMIGLGFGVAAAAMVGQNLGARQPDRAARAGWIALAYATAPGFIAAIAQLAVPERLAFAFTGDAAVMTEAANYLRIIAISQLFISAELVLEGALGGAGYTIAPMLTSTTLNLARIPLAGFAAAKMGPPGIWWVISMTAIGRGLGMAIIWKLGRWRSTSV